MRPRDRLSKRCPTRRLRHISAISNNVPRSLGGDPDYTAAYAFDAANILVDAVRSAGLNRARIRDAVRADSPYRSVTGTIEWDPQGQNRTAAAMRAITNVGQPN